MWIMRCSFLIVGERSDKYEMRKARMNPWVLDYNQRNQYELTILNKYIEKYIEINIDIGIDVCVYPLRRPRTITLQ